MSVIMVKNGLKLTLSVFLMLLALAAVPALAGNNSGGAFSTWPDTGQTKCYNNTAEIPCPAPGEPFYGQDAQYARPARSYTVLGGGEMVMDNVTGLVWEMKTNMDGVTDYADPHDADNGYTWCDPNTDTNNGNQGTCGDRDTQDFIDQLNSSNFGGQNDWRMPTQKELQTLYDLGRNFPVIDPIFAVANKFLFYWSSTTNIHWPNNAWTVIFSGWNFGIEKAEEKSWPYHVRAVRGGQVQSENRFVDNQDGTVTDTVTCLQWQKATMDTVNGIGPDIYNWQDALAVCEDLSLAGHFDWHLPDMNELRSLVDYSRYDPAIDPVFAATTVTALPYYSAGYYWSSTTSVVYGNHGSYGTAWSVHSAIGYASNITSKESGIYGNYVRAVRSAQCRTSIPRGSGRSLAPIYLLLD